MMGSGVFAGKFDLQDTLDKRDEQGLSVGAELQRIGYAGSRAVLGHPAGAYFEARIEQGPVLEDQATTIGVVMGCLGQKWFDLTLTGVEAHAGLNTDAPAQGRPGRRRRGGQRGQPHRPSATTSRLRHGWLPRPCTPARAM